MYSTDFKTRLKYFRLRLYDSQFKRPTSRLNNTSWSHPEVILKSSWSYLDVCLKIWARIKKNECSRQLCAERTDGYTDRRTEWHPELLSESKTELRLKLPLKTSKNSSEKQSVSWIPWCSVNITQTDWIWYGFGKYSSPEQRLPWERLIAMSCCEARILETLRSWSWFMGQKER